MSSEFWKNKNVLITGHTGFKGSWLSLWLQQLGANVTGFSLTPPTKPSLFEVAHVASGMHSIIGDIRDINALEQAFTNCQPEIVLHLAAQSLVRESYLDPVGTYSTNVMGSLNVLEAVRKCSSVRAVVMISTDKCYENKESEVAYKEQDTLGGFDPYSNSKACLELMVACYQKSYFPVEQYNQHQVAIATARAGNVIGGGDWAKDRLIPDILTSIKKQESITLRYPNAIRPWQHVLEPLAGYLLLANRLFEQGAEYACSWNFGPDASSEKSVKWLTEYLLTHIENSSELIIKNENEPHEAALLKLDCTKASTFLHWQPKWDISQTLDQVISWSLAHQSAEYDMREFCFEQISAYCKTGAQLDE